MLEIEVIGQSACSIVWNSNGEPAAQFFTDWGDIKLVKFV